jgi:hypothetical protein
MNTLQNWHIVSFFSCFNVCLTLKSFAWRAAFAFGRDDLDSVVDLRPRAWVGTSVRIYSPTCFSRYLVTALMISLYVFFFFPILFFPYVS